MRAGGFPATRWPTAPPLEASDLPLQPALPRVRILHVITRFWAGAGGNTLLSATGMDSRCYEVWIAGVPGGPLWERAEAAGIRTVQLKRFGERISLVDDARVLAQLVRLMRRERFTIVHTHSTKAGFLGRLGAWISGIPVVVHTFHGFSFHPHMRRSRQALYIALERAVRPMTHEFLAVAPRVAREAVERKLARPGSITVVPSAIELMAVPRSAKSFRAEFGIPEHGPLVGTVGRVDVQKSPLDFVRMAASVAAARPDARFMVVGDGPLLVQAQAEADRLGVDICFTGSRTDAPEVCATFDVFVISSIYEGLGRALTEALASGRPVVATAVNGVPDLIHPGRTGLLAPPNDPEAIARGVLWCLDHPDEAARMGEAGRKIVHEHFQPARMCALIDDVYRRLLGLPRDESSTDVVDSP